MLAEVLLAVLLVIPVALLFGPLGLGGGLLYVPLLHFVVGWSWAEATAASLVLVWSVSLGSRLAHSRAGHADPIVARVMIRGALPGALIGGGLFWLVQASDDLWLKLLAASLVAWSLTKTLRRLLGAGQASEEGTGVTRGWPASGAAGVGGVASTLLGVGGGVVYVPTARFFGGLASRDAVGTSNRVMSWMVPVSFAIHVLIDPGRATNMGDLGWFTIPLLLLVGSASSFAGARFAIRHLRPRTVTWVFVAVLAVTLSRYLWDFVGRLLG